MAELRFDGFEWDKGNSSKNLKKHGVAKETVEAIFHSSPGIADDSRHSGREKRFIAVGVTEKGRWIIVAFTMRENVGKRLLRPISARYMHAREVKRYAKADQD